jgi:Mg-chelatase subunit ChlD
MRLPVAVEPVNEMARTSGWRHSGSPASAVAVHDVEHARRDAGLQRQLAQARGGQRRQLAHLQHRRVAEGQAGATFQVAVMKGTFHGLISAHTPTGWNSV